MRWRRRPRIGAQVENLFHQIEVLDLEHHEAVAYYLAQFEARWNRWYPPKPISSATHAVLTIQGATMASDISVDSATATVTLSFVDARGNAAAAPAGATVAYAGDNDAVATVDAASGKITPVAVGTFDASATVTNADGTPTLEPDGVTPFAPAPVSVTVDPGAAASAVLTVTP